MTKYIKKKKVKKDICYVCGKKVGKLEWSWHYNHECDKKMIRMTIQEP